MSAGAEKCDCNVVMQSGRRGDAHRVHAAEELAVVGERGDTQFFCDPLAVFRRNIRYAYERSTIEHGIFLRVKASEVANADYRSPNAFHLHPPAHDYSHAHARRRLPLTAPPRTMQLPGLEPRCESVNRRQQSQATPLVRRN